MKDGKVDLRGLLDKRMTLVVILVIIAVVVVSFAVTALTYKAGPDIRASGYMLISSTGEWNGTDQASYDVQLDFNGDIGTLTVTYVNGTFDPVLNNTLKIYSIQVNGDKYSLQTDSGVLQFVKYSDIEDIFNGTVQDSYVALQSNDRQIGLVSPAMFGLPEGYLVAIVLVQA